MATGAQLGDSGGGPFVRGSADGTPLSDVGRAQAKALGAALARRGGLTCAYLSSALRARQTANEIIAACPTTELEKPAPDLLSWRLGGLEGAPLVEAQPKILALAKYLPSQAPNGRSDITDLPGESFDDFRGRVLAYCRQQFLEVLRNPKLKLGIVSHHRVLKLLDAWIAAGGDAFGTVDANRFASPAELGKPGGVWRIELPQLKLVPFSIAGNAPLQPGVFFVRHCATAMNSGSYTNGGSATGNRQSGS